MPIRKLPPLLVNQIAAGEVIERPASVVKELIENGLDAGAHRIEITVEAGGHRLIRVSDDGRGIPAPQLSLAIASHATSKLSAAEYLGAIRTLGFRGEALASISSVSRLRLTSRATIEGAASEAGAVIEASGDQVSAVAPSPCAPGTVVEVRDLFFNTPARRKFLRSASTEYGHIADTVARTAMVNHTVAFRLTHNGRTTLDLSAPNQPPRSARAQRCIDVLGKDIEEALLEFEHEDRPLFADADPAAMPGSHRAHLWGMAGMPTLARSSSRFQYLCVNSRPIRNRNLAHAVKEAYRGLIPQDKQPVAVVFIDIEPSAVDVNVHPTKAEVRFRNPSQVHGMVLAAIRQRLLGTDLTPSATLGAPARSDLILDEPALPGRHTTAPTSAADFVNCFKRMDPAARGFVYEQVKQALAEQEPRAPEQQPLVPARPGDDTRAADIRPRNILQVHNSYVVTQDKDGLLIVDQHALHERVMFEELYERIIGDGSSLQSQRLLMPQVMQADARRQAQLVRLKTLLNRIGVEVEPFGTDAVAVQAFPTFLFDHNVEPCPFLADLLDKAENGDIELSNPNAQEAVLHKVLDLMACKAAVKAGDHLSEDELAELLAKRDQIERSSNCPHGRPTTLRLTLHDLDKQFGRT